MATLAWSQCHAVESIPGKHSGAWVFKGTRMPVATVFENLQDMSVDEFEVMVTTEKNQRNHTNRKLAIVVIGHGRWRLMKPHVAEIAAAVNASTPGSYAEVFIPFE